MPIKLKRSAVSGKAPVTTDLELGELALNTFDGKLYTKRNNGTDSIVEIGRVYSVAGKTGTVTLAKADVGLGNVDNTSDANKPISTATQTALNGKANSTHNHAISDVTNLQTALDGKISFPSGTAMLFVQSTAPTGWTKSTTHNNKALRLVSGTAGSGGSVAFTTAFASQAVSGSVSGTVGSATLTTTQMPSHRHNVLGDVLFGSLGGGTLTPLTQSGNIFAPTQTTDVGGGGSHNHSWSGSFTGTAINLAVQYVDAIICTKD